MYSKLLFSILLGAVMLTPASNYAQPTADEIAKITAAVPEAASARPQKPHKVLIFTRTEGFVHASIPYGTKALQIMADKTGAFAVDVSEDMTVFERSNLEKYDAICLMSTTQLKFENLEYRENLLDFVKSGKGIIGIHAATDNFYNWPEAAAMMGGLFDEHPWHGGGTWAVKIDDPAHPVLAAFKGQGFTINDELYRFRKLYSRENVRVLMSLNFDDEATNEVEGIRPNDFDVPVSWVREFGAGRVFYSSIGHNPQVYWNPTVLQHYLDGIQFALGDLAADATPSLEVALSALAKYDYGQSLQPLVMINDFIRFSNDSAEALRRLENRFLQLFADDLSLAARQYICEKLRIIGSEASVPVLTSMLGVPATAEMARYALEGMPGTAIDEALLGQIRSSSGRAQIGMINTLGLRHAVAAVDALAALLTSEQVEVAHAAAAALANIATPEAANQLEKARAANRAADKSVLTDLLLRCAENLQKAGEQKHALAFYGKLYNRKESAFVQAAALRGLVLSGASDADKLVTRAVKGGQPELQSAAIGLLREIDDSKTVQNIVRELPKLNETAQIQMLAALSERGKPDVLKYVLEVTKSDSEQVRVSALQTLAYVGDASTVGLLAKTAAGQSGLEAQVARASLNRMAGSEVDAAIGKEIPAARAAQKAELVRAAGERGIDSASAAVLAAAKDASPDVRVAALRALRAIGEPDKLPDIVALLDGVQSNRERRELELTIPAVAKKIPQADQRSQAVLALLPTVENVPDKVSLLTVLGKIGATNALPTLQKYLDDDRPQIAAAAIRALSDWPDNTPVATLYSIATSARSDVHRILGLRGYVRMLSLDSISTPAENVEKYRDAMTLAQNDGEKRMVLSALADLQTAEALKFAGEFLDDSSLQQEAGVAALKIAEALQGRNIPDMSMILRKVASVSTSNGLHTKADSLARVAEKIEDHITNWLVAGPYEQKDANLMDFIFAPESTGDDVQWQPFQAETNPGQFWRLELDKVIGGDRRVVYLRSQMWSEKAQQARLETGSDDGIKIWLNGKMVFVNDISRGCTPGDDVVDVSLQKGWNTLMLKVVNKSGGWAACARVRQPDGSRITGLKIQAAQ